MAVGEPPAEQWPEHARHDPDDDVAGGRRGHARQAVHDDHQRDRREEVAVAGEGRRTEESQGRPPDATVARPAPGVRRTRFEGRTPQCAPRKPCG